MQIVIEISEEYYNRCKDYVSANDADYHHIKIANGTPLPKGHGRLIDADALVKSDCFWETEYEVTNAPTIIEADKESESK